MLWWKGVGGGIVGSSMGVMVGGSRGCYGGKK